MENNYFIFAENNSNIEFERFHICSWEFKNSSALIEFGGEIKKSDAFKKDKIELKIHIPWITNKHKITDLYDKLKESENSRFIFNDSVTGNKFLDNGQKKDGVIQEFVGRNPLCIIPFNFKIDDKNRIVTIIINLKPYKNTKCPEDTNLYFRFHIEPNLNLLSTRKSGVSRSTIIYDVKINEKRNLPENSNIDLQEYQLCKIHNCFYFNILPNSYDLTFFDAGALKNIRTLEYDSFKKYIGDDRVKKDELVVVFNKKENKESYSFFSIFARERIGAGQFALAILINIVCGFLLFIPSYRKTFIPEMPLSQIWTQLPIEIFIAIGIAGTVLIYFVWPYLNKSWNWLINKTELKK